MKTAAIDIAQVTGRVQRALDELRPFLAADGGDISLDEITAEGLVRVRLHGACTNCSMSAMTMRAGVEEAIKRVAPEITAVEAVNLPIGQAGAGTLA